MKLRALLFLAIFAATAYADTPGDLVGLTETGITYLLVLDSGLEETWPDGKSILRNPSLMFFTDPRRPAFLDSRCVVRNAESVTCEPGSPWGLVRYKGYTKSKPGNSYELWYECVKGCSKRSPRKLKYHSSAEGCFNENC